MSQKLQVVAFDNPFPPNYGGVIDAFYQVKALAALGISIDLHCYVDDRRDIKELESFCNSVHVYPKTSRLGAVFSKLPITLACRDSKVLVENLLQNKAPVLILGVQAAAILDSVLPKLKPVYLRIFNIEQDYFRGLTKAVKNPIKAWIFKREAQKFEGFESMIQTSQHVFTLSHYDQDYYARHYRSTYVPVFHGNEEVSPLSEFGDFALYHGNLSVPDNYKVACFLIEVFKELDYPLVIAGSYRERSLRKQIKNLDHISLESIENSKKLDKLLRCAHITLNWSFQRAGTKLKVINSLFKSRHCLINEHVIDEPEAMALSYLCHSKSEIQEQVKALRLLPFTDFEKRKKLREDLFNNRKNAKKVQQAIFG